MEGSSDLSPRRGALLRVLLADDHALFRRALDELLAEDGRIEVVGHAADGRQAVELARALAPDLVLMDVDMPVMSGMDATRRIKELDLPTCVVIVSSSDTAADRDRAREAGAAAYFTKDAVSHDFADRLFATR